MDQPRRKRGKRLRPAGGYRLAASFQTATLIYDATVLFCKRFVTYNRRLAEQMVNAARSGRQNIAEASRVAATSSQSELRLLGVARGSLEELLLDFEDYLRHRGLRQWEADSPEAREVRAIAQRGHTGRRGDRADGVDGSDGPRKGDRRRLVELTDRERWQLYARWLENPDPAVCANALICLIHQANYLLDRQMHALECKFVNEGGYTEQLASERLKRRAEQHEAGGKGKTSTPPRAAPPLCPECGGAMVVRTARRGRRAGQQFWGCAAYPKCKGVVPI